MNLIVAVTGGIGSGKSTAARLFQERGAGLVDTDAIAHELTLTGRPALDKIVGRFGAGVPRARRQSRSGESSASACSQTPMRGGPSKTSSIL